MLFGTIDPITPISGNIVGMRVSHIEFLTALITYSSFSEYHFFAGDSHTFQQCQDFLQELSAHTSNVKKVKIISRNDIPRYLKSRNYTVFHRHDPKIFQLLYMRDTYATSPFPVTGIIHSISYQRFMHDYLDIFLSNVQQYGTILCTSTGSREVMSKLFTCLSGKGKKYLTPDFQYNGRFELLPFGIESNRFTPASSEEKKAIRQRLNLPLDQLLVLTVSRFSQYSKMDLFPIIRTLQPLFSRNSNLSYIIAGSGYESDYPEKIKAFAHSLGIDQKIIIRKNIDEATKLDLYRAADIFLSPSDNPQESFGITLLEAMPSGLPVIASDWDGYRDIVEKGKTGYLIETIWGACDKDITPLAPLSFEREYHLHLGQSVAININKLQGRLEELITDKEKRETMGASGRERILAGFTWNQIIERYERLVQKKKEIAEQQEFMRRKPEDYLYLLDYFSTFNHYATKILSDDDIVSVSEFGRNIIAKKGRMTLYEGMEAVLEIDLVILILQHISHQAMSVRNLRDLLGTKYPPHRVTYAILWMIKNDYICPIQDP